MNSPIVVRSGAATHAGLRRPINEDSHLAQAPLFLVADGMGGHAAGDLASAAVVEEFGALLNRGRIAVDDMSAALERSKARVDALPSGARPAGTTLSGVAVSDVNGAAYWLVINVGDSRTYRYADGALDQITIDHSMVQEMLDNGEVELAQRVRRNVITRAIGAGSTGIADFWMIPAEVGDRILVCSDGLTNELDDERVREVLEDEADPESAALRLVREAMANGGNDNITAVVVDAVSVAVEAPA
ncbi:PP2C family protein-serine/threonine phosphatase [Microbacterium gorillae]|uniref:PP2C family protein-serine/threonine phosphatase n=1 Tax=Microbacterium gorillae TaxID=1231063 RepID=UPI000AD8F035|nr:protein phosphatase 2C domain-containing protein [Microbacterium gorillae]